jgi:diketogulonate reductase-like aldo/keto reductase
MKPIEAFYTLSNNVKIPKIGFGTAPLKGEECYQSVLTALNTGYRHIDTAEIYKNEHEVGRAIKDSRFKRSDVFITSKLDPKIKSYDDAIEAFESTLKNLDTDYLDLFLIHAPWPWDDVGSDYEKGNVKAYKALEKLYNDGLIKAIGVSNFEPTHLRNILDNTDIIPHVNQIKFHIGHSQDDTIAFCKEHNILVEAYSPLGRATIFSNETIQSMAKKYHANEAHVALSYILSQNILPLPRSKNPNHIKSNSLVDIELKEDDLNILKTLNL